MIGRLLNAATFPATLAHEATHLAVGWPWIVTIRSYELHPLRAAAWVEVEWADSAPRWGVVLAHVAPTLLGVAFAAAVVVLLLVGGGEWPRGAREQGVWLLLGAYWLIYATPSPDDLQPTTGQ